MNAHHRRLAARILADRPQATRRHRTGQTFGTPSLDDHQPGSSIPTTRLMRRAALDLGQSKADRDWSVRNPGRPDDRDDGYRDAMGPIRGDDGCTQRTLDYRHTRDSHLAR